MQTNWYVITGGPGSGKTTLINELQKRGHKTVEEAARLLIEQKLAQGLTLGQIRSDEMSFQEQVFAHKQKQHLALSGDEITFLDRGFHDTVAYMKHFKLQVPKPILDVCKHTRYKRVFVLDMLSYARDSARIEDEDTAQKLHKALIDVYQAYGYEITVVPPMPLAQRVKTIESIALSS